MDRSVLVYRIGSLGDTLVTVPALRAVRNHFPQARVTYLCDRQIGKHYVSGAQVLHGTPLIDDVLTYPFDASTLGRLGRPLLLGRLWITLRMRRFDAVVYLAGSNRPARAVARDRRFFASAGIRSLFGFEGFPSSPAIRPQGGFPPLPHEADLLLARLAVDGITVPAAREADIRFPLSPDDRGEAARWMRAQRSAGGRALISVGPGGKRPANIWPLARYEAVVARLIRARDVWPIVSCGADEGDAARRLIAAWGRGWWTDPALSIRGTIAVLERCVLHVGNDTGTMHLAAAAGVPCVGVFSSIAPPVSGIRTGPATGCSGPRSHARTADCSNASSEPWPVSSRSDPTPSQRLART